MSPLELLQLFIHGRLASESYFGDIGLYVMRPRKKADGTVNTVPQITQKIEEALNGLVPKGAKAGAAVTVYMPVVSVPQADAQGLFTVAVVLRVQENPLVNMGAAGTRKSAESIGLEVIRSLNGWVPHGVANQLYCDREAMVFNEQVSGTSGKWTYDVTVATHLEIEEADRVMIPRISTVGDGPVTVTITCATADATIYYTLDESFPSAANAEALVYSEPLTLTESATLFTAAYKSGLSGSHVQHAEITVGDLVADAGAGDRIVYDAGAQIA